MVIDMNKIKQIIKEIINYQTYQDELDKLHAMYNQKCLQLDKLKKKYDKLEAKYDELLQEANKRRSNK